MNNIKEAFKNIDIKDVGSWSLVVNTIFFIILATVLMIASWIGLSLKFSDDISRANSEEQSLRQEWRKVVDKVVLFPEISSQVQEGNNLVFSLEKQLPANIEIFNILSDISNAGLGRGLVINTLKPNAEIKKDYYYEFPISVSLSGTYDAIAYFISDISLNPKIILIENIKITKKDDAILTLDATIKFYRQLNN